MCLSPREFFRQSYWWTSQLQAYNNLYQKLFPKQNNFQSCNLWFSLLCFPEEKSLKDWSHSPHDHTVPTSLYSTRLQSPTDQSKLIFANYCHNRNNNLSVMTVNSVSSFPCLQLPRQLLTCLMNNNHTSQNQWQLSVLSCIEKILTITLYIIQICLKSRIISNIIFTDEIGN